MQLGGTPAQLFDAVRDGVVDIVWANPGYKPGAFTKTEVFELPFMVTKAPQGSRAMWDFVETYAKDEFKGIRLLWVGVSDPQLLHFSTKDVKSLEDAKGLKMRSPGRFVAKGLTDLGMVPIQMPAMAITESLSKGVIDGAVVTWSGVPMLKLDEVSKFHLDVPVGKPGFSASTTVFAMNPSKYDSLPPELKKVIDDNSGREASAASGQFHVSKVTPYEQQSVRGGAKSEKLSDAEYARWVKTTAPVEAEWVKEVNAKGADGAKLLQEAKLLVRKYSQ